jgi:hypothetical protein
MGGNPGRARTREAGISAGANASAAAMSVPEVFQRITAALDQAGIGYMLSGSFASAYYGAPRSTQDIDLVIEANRAHLRTFVQGLSGAAYYVDLDAALEAHKRQSMFNVIDLSTGWKVDLIICKARAFSREEFRRRRLVNVQGFPLFVASAEDVVVSKLEWSKLAQSSRHIADVAGILRMRWESMDRSYLEKWILELGLEVEWKDARRVAEIAETT